MKLFKNSKLLIILSVALRRIRNLAALLLRMKTCTYGMQMLCRKKVRRCINIGICGFDKVFESFSAKNPKCVEISLSTVFAVLFVYGNLRIIEV